MLKKLLEKTNSSINGEITIYSLFGSPKMYIGGLLQSGGIVSDIWKKGAKVVSSNMRQASSILILGLGCGTAAKVFSQKWPKAKIVGVEIDKEVIRLGKKYFGLGQIPNLKIICSDGIKVVARNQKSEVRKSKKNTGSWKLEAGSLDKFDLVIVDLYLGEKIPSESESLDFLRDLKNLLNRNGVIIFNRIFWGKHKAQAEDFVKRSEKLFSKVKLIRVIANLLIFCQK